MRIAVLSTHFQFDRDWLIDQFKRENTDYKYIESQGIICTKLDTYVIITQAEHILGQEFHYLIKGPSYITLEDMVRSRIK